MKFARFAVFLALVSSAAPIALHADSYTFTAVGNSFETSGTLTTVLDPNYSGVYDVTAISGEVNGVSITGLIDGSYDVNSPTMNQNNSFTFDNVFYGSSPTLDLQGLGFNIGTSGYGGNLYFQNGNYVFADTNFQVTQMTSYTSAETPEPSSLLLLGTGVIGAACVFGRRLLPRQEG